MAPERPKRIISILFAVPLGAVAAYAGAQIMVAGAPLIIYGGLLLVATAPLGFVLRPPATDSRQHPVVISALCGLGCVMVMVGIQRYGDHHQPVLVAALLVLLGWVIYQKRIWRG